MFRAHRDTFSSAPMKASDPVPSETAAASLTGRARSDALHALRVLAEAEETPAGDEEMPPLPEALRDQWQETYGEALPDSASGGIRESRLRRLAGFFARPRIAWAGGLAAAAAVMVLLMQTEPDPADPSGAGKVVTRGGASGAVAGAAARLILVAPAEPSAALLAELTRAFPARSIERVDELPADAGDDAIVIDAAARTVRRGGAAEERIAGDPFAGPAAVIMAIESLDEPAPR